ncbi:MAG: response regulator [Fibrobacterales bacterium]
MYKLLVIEDNLISQKTLSFYLQKYGEVISASGGNDGFNQFLKAYKDKEPFDVICLDINMPDKDGITVLNEIRNFEESEGFSLADSCKIFMVTSYDQMDIIIGSFKKLCNGYLTKPLKMEALDEAFIKEGIIINKGD